MLDIIQRLKDAYAAGEHADILPTLLPELFKQYDEGLIPVLPCKVGDTIYFDGGDSVHKGIVTDFDITDKEIIPITGWSCGEAYFHCDYFLTREAAENALKERET